MTQFDPRYIAFVLTVRQEDGDPADHFEHPDDIAYAKRAIEEGNEWGWGTVKLVGTIGHPEKGMLQAVDYLGACSYDSEADFKSGGYYEDMKRNVTAVLEAKWNV